MKSEGKYYQSELEQIQTTIDSIVPECISDSLRNIFLATYYQTYAIGQTELTAPQIQTYTSLANHCPFEQFDAIYRSRSILWSRGDTSIYNDSLLCAPLGLILKALRPIQYTPVAQNKPLSINVYPNPTSGIATIHFSYIPDIPLTIVVTDIIGRELYRVTKTLDMNQQVIDLSRFENGLYVVRVASVNEEVYHMNIQVLK